jgi:hypothetical protein
MLCLSHPPWPDHSNYTWRRVHVKLYEAPHYVDFSNLPSLHFSSVRIFSSASCSQTPQSMFLPWSQRPSFTPTQNHRQNYSFVYSNFYVFRQQTRR